MDREGRTAYVFSRFLPRVAVADLLDLRAVNSSSSPLLAHPSLPTRRDSLRSGAREPESPAARRGQELSERDGRGDEQVAHRDFAANSRLQVGLRSSSAREM